jgi:V8-like Glu-specific endopeptidase
MKQVIALGTVSFFSCAMASTGFAQVVRNGSVVTYTVPRAANQLGAGVDFANSKPLPLPTTRMAPPMGAQAIIGAAIPEFTFGTPGVSPGHAGDGILSPVQLLPPRNIPESQDIREGEDIPVGSEEIGTSNQPYSTSQVNAQNDQTSSFYPYSAAGKLFFTAGGSTYNCSASLIKPGIVVTAGHCVADFGTRQYYSNWQFVPAYHNGSAPYGVWAVKSAIVLASYYDGTDSCAQSGIVCQDDVAVLKLVAQSGRYPGISAGWFTYGWNGYGFNSAGQALINQLGYPLALDGGEYMERNDSQGTITSKLSNNTVIGSLMTGGSSGGPWLVNLGLPPSLSRTAFGSAAVHNAVVGVTSWGYTGDDTIKQQGASSFTSNNIVALVNAACTAAPGAC